jgi:hypothetical protein
MSTFPRTFEGEAQSEGSIHPVQPQRVGFVRRRASPVQGRALETLGHAVEYLVDSRMFQVEETNARDEQEAVQILMRLSRSVFAECPEVVSMRQRLQRWVGIHLVRE